MHETAFARNRAFAAADGHEHATVFPALRLYVVTCLDPRVDPAHVLGLELGDAIVARNGGGRVTDEVIDDVALVSQLAGQMIPDGPLFEVAVIHHTDCKAAARDRSLVDPAATVASDVARLRSADAISPRVTVSGHVYDIATGLVETMIPMGALDPAA